MNNFPTWMHAGLLGMLLAAGVPATSPGLAQTTSQPPQASYATPDEAVGALADAIKQNDVARLHDVLGPGSEKLINSGDPAADSAERARFAAAYDEQHALVADGPDRMTLDIGSNAWPSPIPLVKSGDRWHFDAGAGAQELVDRRIGRNEISAISSMLACVAAQQAYYEMTGKTGQAAYAERIVSRPGRHDGLYWPAAEGQEASPLGDFVAREEAEGYPVDLVAGVRAPYRGYFYRILKQQGPEAPGGAKSYVEHGRMVGGFALVAWPASYGASGIMTFIVDHDGVVFQRDLGSDTAKIVGSMSRYDPELQWARVDVVNQ